jgi:hypothetical protein
MPPTVYHDLAEFGLPFVTPDDSAFPRLVSEIQIRPRQFGPEPDSDLSSAAVLLNQSRKAIVILVYIWKYMMAGGQTRTNRHSTLGSGRQMDVLTGRVGVTRDHDSFILPGSKRLITQEGMFGDNSDVLPADSAPNGGGYGVAGSGSMLRRGRQEKVAGIELDLDFVIFEDGLCVGPDDFGLFENLAQDLKRQRNTAQEVVEALRSEASVGQVFEIVRPLARHVEQETAGSRLARHLPLLSMFARTAIHQLVHASASELLAWFEKAVQPSPIQLHRPS